MRRILATAALSVILAGGAAVTSTPGATADPVPQAATCTGVWVVVDYGSLGGITTGCATSYANGLAALRSAGFDPAISAGFVDQINGKPGKPDSAKAYWSYWHATQDNDGSYGSWDYSALGAGGYRPAKGKAEGWRYQSLEDGKVAPGAKPPTDPGTPTPTPTKTTSKPTPKPTVTKKPTTAKPTVTNKPTTPASGTRAVSTPTSARTTASARATSTATTNTTATSANSTPSPSEAEQSSESIALADGPVQARAEPSSAPDPGTPTGLIVTGGLVVVAGAGLGGWWWLRGRKP